MNYIKMNVFLEGCFKIRSFFLLKQSTVTSVYMNYFFLLSNNNVLLYITKGDLCFFYFFRSCLHIMLFCSMITVFFTSDLCCMCCVYFFQLPLLEKGDIIIDGGNSEYRDTNVSITDVPVNMY